MHWSRVVLMLMLFPGVVLSAEPPQDSDVLATYRDGAVFRKDLALAAWRLGWSYPPSDTDQEAEYLKWLAFHKFISERYRSDVVADPAAKSFLSQLSGETRRTLALAKWKAEAESQSYPAYRVRYLVFGLPALSQKDAPGQWESLNDVHGELTSGRQTLQKILSSCREGRAGSLAAQVCPSYQETALFSDLSSDVAQDIRWAAERLAGGDGSFYRVPGDGGVFLAGPEAKGRVIRALRPYEILQERKGTGASVGGYLAVQDSRGEGGYVLARSLSPLRPETRFSSPIRGANAWFLVELVDHRSLTIEQLLQSWREESREDIWDYLKEKADALKSASARRSQAGYEQYLMNKYHVPEGALLFPDNWPEGKILSLDKAGRIRLSSDEFDAYFGQYTVFHDAYYRNQEEEHIARKTAFRRYVLNTLYEMDASEKSAVPHENFACLLELHSQIFLTRSYIRSNWVPETSVSDATVRAEIKQILRTDDLSHIPTEQLATLADYVKWQKIRSGHEDVIRKNKRELISKIGFTAKPGSKYQ